MVVFCGFCESVRPDMGFWTHHPDCTYVAALEQLEKAQGIVKSLKAAVEQTRYES